MKRLNLKVGFLISKSLGKILLEKLHIFFDVNNIIVFHPNDKSDERSKFFEIKELCKNKNIKIKFSKDKKNFYNQIYNEKLDIIFCSNWYYMIDKKILYNLSDGAYGIHPSLLPKYKGGSPLSNSIINGDKIIGTTFFKFTDKVDSGPILDQFKFKLKKHENIKNALNIIEKYYFKNLKKIFNKIMKKKYLKINNKLTNQIYKIRNIKDNWIDFTQSSNEINNFIRAISYPYPGALMKINNQMIIIDECVQLKKKIKLIIGRIYVIKKNKKLVLACKDDNLLEITKLRNMTKNKFKERFKNAIRHI